MTARIRTRGTFSDLLVAVWRLLAAGRGDEARPKLLSAWSFCADAFAGEQDGRVALRLFERLAPCYDDPDGWARLPDELTVYRAGAPDGFAWTTDRDVAERLHREYGGALHKRTVFKREVLAYITHYGEDEIVLRPSGA